MKLIDLIKVFLKINFLSFGGPSVGILLLEEELVIKNNYLSREDFENIFITTNVVPGPVFIQLSVLVGHKICGIKGAICCLLVSIIPIPLITILLYFYLQKFIDPKVFNKMILFISPVIIISLIDFVKRLFLKSKANINIYLIFIELIISCILYLVIKLPLIVCILIIIPFMLVLELMLGVKND